MEITSKHLNLEDTMFDITNDSLFNMIILINCNNSHKFRFLHSSFSLYWQLVSLYLHHTMLLKNTNNGAS